MLVSHIVAPLVLALWPVSPVVALPDELELCIHKADICVLQLERDVCGDASQEDRGQFCTVPYEDCSYHIDEAHEVTCRIEYVWCRLEVDATWSSPAYQEHCEDVYAACPSI